MRRRLALLLVLLGLLAAFWHGSLVLLGIGRTGGAEDWVWDLPSYVPPPRVPVDNPMSESRFQLGRYLFYDVRLSGPGTVSCASCHRQARAFADAAPRSRGATGQPTRRNAPGIANAAWHATYTWANPAIVALEQQLALPLFGDDPVEMGVTDANRDAVLARIGTEPVYRQLFPQAFPEDAVPVSFANIFKAIAAFQRGIVATDSRYDRYLRGEAELTAAELRGLDLFFGETAECHHCHGSFNFDDQVVHATSRIVERPFHNTGLYNIDGEGAYPAADPGLFEITGDAADMGRFRAPSLRNVAVTAPYTHDGSVATLSEMLDIYAAGGRVIAAGPNAGDGRVSPHKSPLLVRIALSGQDKQDLLAFLHTLTDETLLTSERYGNPWQEMVTGGEQR